MNVNLRTLIHTPPPPHVFGVDAERNIYVIDWWRGQGVLSDTLRSITNLVKRYEPAGIIVEGDPGTRAVLSMLRDHLRIRFGTSWHGSPAAGRFLKEIWETGQLYTADELSREIGLGPLEPQILTAALREGLSL